MLIGYVRVSTAEQNEARQLLALQEKGVAAENIYMDKLSGKNAERPKLKEMLSFCRKGDTVIAESISRIARNTRDLLEIVETLREKGVGFVSMKEGIDTETAQGQFMLTVFAAMAQLERESILERQKEGIAIAKAEGKYKGRQKIKVDEKLFADTVARWRAGEITAVKAQEITGLKPNTFYRKVKEMSV